MATGQIDVCTRTFSVFVQLQLADIEDRYYYKFFIAKEEYCTEMVISLGTGKWVWQDL
jgi:hypothetical protein